MRQARLIGHMAALGTAVVATPGVTAGFVHIETNASAATVPVPVGR